jgi:hypothetical protein
VWILLLIKVLALGFAGYDSVRGRFWPGVGALVSALYLTAARLAGVLPPHPYLPMKDALERTWWLYPCAVFFLSLGPMLFAFRTASRLPSEDPRHRHLERAGFAFLANVLLDAAVLVIVAVAMLLSARGA